MIFVKYRDDAQRTLDVARREARRLSHNYVGTEHLLLALTSGDFGIATRVLTDSGITAPALKRQVIHELDALHDDLTDTDADALASVGIDLHEVRRRIEDAFGPTALGGPPPCPTGIPFTDKALRALKATPRHARRLGHRHVGPEHLLLAVIDDESALAARLMQRLGGNPEVVRNRLLSAIGSS